MNKTVFKIEYCSISNIITLIVKNGKNMSRASDKWGKSVVCLVKKRDDCAKVAQNVRRIM